MAHSLCKSKIQYVQVKIKKFDSLYREKFQSQWKTTELTVVWKTP